jgi:hypothetical protein
MSQMGHFRRMARPDEFVACPLYLQLAPEFVHCVDLTKSANNGHLSAQLKALKSGSIVDDIGCTVTRVYEMCLAGTHCKRK